jgi:hypothetical protein
VRPSWRGGSWQIGRSQPSGGKHVEKGSVEVEPTGEDGELTEAFARRTLTEPG